jgi:hypothetical protein
MQIMYVAMSSGSVPVYEQLPLHGLGPQPATAAAAPPPGACQHDSEVPLCSTALPGVQINAECTFSAPEQLLTVAGCSVTICHSCTCAGSMDMQCNELLSVTPNASSDDNELCSDST